MKTHSHARPVKSPTYGSWQSMKQRCNNPNATGYSYYGGRGITVCERWNDFINFLSDMGDRPEGTTLDRINNDDGYFPENCQWSTKKEQVANRRLKCNMQGERHGMLVVVKRSGTIKVGSGRTYRIQWECLCDCGEEFIATGQDIRNGRIVSCGCRKRSVGKLRALNHSGSVYNGVRMVSRAGSNKYGKATWNCICHCGNGFIALGTEIKSGHTKSCGHKK